MGRSTCRGPHSYFHTSTAANAAAIAAAGAAAASAAAIDVAAAGAVVAAAAAALLFCHRIQTRHLVQRASGRRDTQGF